MITKQEKMDKKIEKIYGNWERTIKTAIDKAVELTRNQNSDLHVVIFIRKSGALDVSEILTYNTSIHNKKLFSMCDVFGWQENIIDVKKKTQEVEEEIKKNNLVGNSLYPQKN